MDNKIRSFQDLRVYQQTYRDSLIILDKVVPKLPIEEKYNLKSQLRRSCMAIPPLIAEGFAKKHLRRAFSKYLDDANGECNEVIVHLSYCRDLYSKLIDVKLVNALIKSYDKSARQIYKLSLVWKKFSDYNMKWISPLLRKRGTTGKFPIPALRGRGSIHLKSR